MSLDDLFYRHWLIKLAVIVLIVGLPWALIISILAWVGVL